MEKSGRRRAIPRKDRISRAGKARAGGAPEGGGPEMIQSTLCYIERGGSYLMLHRVKKERDANRDKWIGVGGKFEDKESPEDCVRREVREETGLVLKECRYRGIVTFVSDEWETEYMHLFTAPAPEGDAWPRGGDAPLCDEGVLEWVPKERVPELPIWEGDRIFLRLLAQEHPFFSLKLEYRGERLVSAVLDGKALEG